MAKIVGTVSDGLVEAITAHINDHIVPQMRADVSNYAKGRMRVWLPYEAPLSNSRNWEMGIADDRLWSWIVRTLAHYNFVADTCLISKAGTITRHRDASYANYRSMTINLGVCSFFWEDLYPDYHYAANTASSGTAKSLALTGGEIIEFNAKNPHWVADVDAERIGINAWSVKPDQRAKFEAFKR